MDEEPLALCPPCFARGVESVMRSGKCLACGTVWPPEFTAADGILSAAFRVTADGRLQVENDEGEWVLTRDESIAIACQILAERLEELDNARIRAENEAEMLRP